jgi:hypothetical protein
MGEGLRVEVGSRPLSAGDVALLPFAIVLGPLSGLYALGTGPTLSHREDIRRNVSITVWLERSTFPIMGTQIEIAVLTGSAGRDWVQILHTGVIGNGKLVTYRSREGFRYPLCFIMRQSSCIAADEIRWRVSYDAR